jgi:hypothetical protein
MENDLDILNMNDDMYNICKSYLQLCMWCSNRLEEIHADEELNMNLQLVKASLTDLDININNFKDAVMDKFNLAEEVRDQIRDQVRTTALFQNANSNIDNQDNQENQQSKQQMLAFFFLFLMKCTNNSDSSPFTNARTKLNYSNSLRDEPDVD